ncbi:MAG TPA: hypothetical protein VEB18_01230 [Candidatus Paceibacterota bacterium]|nr:hypothetical protein [Candidatus Paceibacterota bacterium]
MDTGTTTPPTLPTVDTAPVAPPVFVPSISQPPPAQPPVSSVPPAKQHRSFGPTFGAIVILLIIVVGALYMWGAHIAQEQGTSVPVEHESE